MFIIILFIFPLYNHIISCVLCLQTFICLLVLQNANESVMQFNPPNSVAYPGAIQNTQVGWQTKLAAELYSNNNYQPEIHHLLLSPYCLSVCQTLNFRNWKWQWVSANTTLVHLWKENSTKVLSFLSQAWIQSQPNCFHILFPIRKHLQLCNYEYVSIYGNETCSELYDSYLLVEDSRHDACKKHHKLEKLFLQLFRHFCTCILLNLKLYLYTLMHVTFISNIKMLLPRGI
jgi:hypothetical protein